MRRRTFIRPRNDEFVEADTALCLGASHNMSPLNNRCVVCYSNPQDHSIMRGFMKECAPTLNAAAGMSGNNRPFIVSSRKNPIVLNFMGCKGNNAVTQDGTCPTITRMHGNDVHVVCTHNKI